MLSNQLLRSFSEPFSWSNERSIYEKKGVEKGQQGTLTICGVKGLAQCNSNYLEEKQVVRLSDFVLYCFVLFF